MKTSFLFIVIIVLSLAYSCNANSDNSSEIPSPPLSEIDLTKGFVLTESYCFSCHSPDASMDNRIAPPMIAVKKHYIDEQTSVEDFVQDLTHFVENPSVDISKMPGAVAKFNLMPKMSFNAKELKLIAQYIYHSELEKPEWFEDHYQEEKKKYSEQTNNDELSYLEKGQQYALATKAILGKNLIGAINDQGTAKALSFCNTKAIHLTDSMAVEQGVSIKRVSDFERNPNNRANEEELKPIEIMKTQLTNGENAQAIIVENANQVTGYYPIITNTMCLQCHGESSLIDVETQLAIDKLYPEDKAIGYGENELRGIWVIEMLK